MAGLGGKGTGTEPAGQGEGRGWCELQGEEGLKQGVMESACAHSWGLGSQSWALCAVAGVQEGEACTGQSYMWQGRTECLTRRG